MSSLLLPLLLGGANLASQLFAKKPTQQKFTSLTPEQEQLQNQLLSLLTQGGDQEGLLGELFGEKGFEQFAAPYRREFFESTLPGIAERFTSLGAQKSSGFQQALTRSAESLSEKLAGLRSQQQFGALGGLLGRGLQPTFTTGFRPGSPGILSDFLSPINLAYGQHIGSKLGGLL